MAYPDVVLADTPFSYWRLGDPAAAGGETLVDDSGNSHLAQFQNSCVALEVGASGDGDTAVKFNGTNAYVKRGGGPDGFVGTGSCSVELWVKAAAAAASRRSLICCGYGHASGLAGWNLDVTATQIIAEVRTPTVTEAAFTVAYGDNAYRHLVLTLTRGAPDVVTLYINGLSVAATNLGASGLTLQPHPAFAFYLATDSDETVMFAGTLDEIALYNTALSAGQVFAHYAAAAGANSPIGALFFL